MEKFNFGILLYFGLIIGLAVGLFLLQPEFEKDMYVSGEELEINNVKFNGTSGFSNNSILFNLENKNSEMDVVVNRVKVVSADSFNRTFYVIPEENNFPMGSKRQITLTNVGWMKDIKYVILIFSSTNTLCDSFTITA